MPLNINKNIIKKFDVPGPRYTSYPTAPNWSDSVSEAVYIDKLKTLGQSSKTLSLYIHIPFCQSLCTFCACNVVIRQYDDKYGEEYLTHLFKEIDLIADYIGRKIKVKQFHWGGGTPTYLNEEQIERLFVKVGKRFDIDFDGEIAIEVDPRTITQSKMAKLRKLGFNRVSMGVQDFERDVQESINRIQPLAMVKEVNQWCRDLKFHSVNFDLIYGLPNQTQATFQKTVDDVIALKPDRVALYSFAYVPWLKKHQNKMDSRALPGNDVKLDIFLTARGQFFEAGYQAIAMDHFALKDDELAKAFNKGELYRNFMGYTVKPADEYVGLGVTSIGFLEKTFVQSVKVLPEYYRLLKEGRLPIERGKELTTDDQIRQWTINALMCQFALNKTQFAQRFGVSFDEYFQKESEHIEQCVKNDLIVLEKDQIIVTHFGKIFIRNVCMGFDWYLQQQDTHKRFSQTI